MAEEFTGDTLSIVATSVTKDGINHSPAFRYNDSEYFIIPYVRMCATSDEAKAIAQRRLRDLSVFTRMTFMYWGLDKQL